MKHYDKYPRIDRGIYLEFAIEHIVDELELILNLNPGKLILYGNPWLASLSNKIGNVIEEVEGEYVLPPSERSYTLRTSSSGRTRSSGRTSSSGITSSSGRTISTIAVTDTSRETGCYEKEKEKEKK
jgi:hypothetical protein